MTAAREFGTAGPGAEPAAALILEGHSEEGIAILRDELALHPAKNVALYKLASALAYCGRFAEADELFRLDIPIDTGNGGVTNTKIVRLQPQSHLDPDDISPLEAPYQAGRFIDCIRRDDFRGTDIVYFISCDSAYMKLFAMAVTRSVQQNCRQRAGVHLHLINPDHECFRIAHNIVSTSEIAVAISHVSVSLRKFPPAARNVYYTVERLIALPEILKVYDRPVLMADADQLVVANLSDLISAVEPYDAGLLFSPKEVTNFFALFSATAMLVRPTMRGYRLAARMRDYIATQMNTLRGDISWHLDQVAIAASTLQFPDLKWYAIPPNLVQSDINGVNPENHIVPGTIFWSLNFAHSSSREKLKSEIFRRYDYEAEARD